MGDIAMSVNWDFYEPFDPGVDGPLHELPRKEAREAFKRIMAAKEERIDQLKKLLERNGIALRSTDDGLMELEAWYRNEVERDAEKEDRLRPLWYAVTFDIGLFISEVMIERAPNLRWEFFTYGAKNVSYHRPVLMGFSKIPNPKYNTDVDFVVATFGLRIVLGLPVKENLFVSMVHSAVEKA